jgi:hypothetical protein
LSSSVFQLVVLIHAIKLNTKNKNCKLVPVPSHLEVEIPIAQLKKHTSSGSDQIPAQLIQAGGEIFLSVTHKFINSTWNKEDLLDQ